VANLQVTGPLDLADWARGNQPPLAAGIHQGGGALKSGLQYDGLTSGWFAVAKTSYVQARETSGGAKN